MYVLNRGGVMIKSRLSLETTLSILTKQNFDLLLTEPLNMNMLTPQESIQNRVINVSRVLTCSNKDSSELFDSQTARA